MKSSAFGISSFFFVLITYYWPLAGLHHTLLWQLSCMINLSANTKFPYPNTFPNPFLFGAKSAPFKVSHVDVTAELHVSCWQQLVRSGLR